MSQRIIVQVCTLQKSVKSSRHTEISLFLSFLFITLLYSYHFSLYQLPTNFSGQWQTLKTYKSQVPNYAAEHAYSVTQWDNLKTKTLLWRIQVLLTIVWQGMCFQDTVLLLCGASITTEDTISGTQESWNMILWIRHSNYLKSTLNSHLSFAGL